MAPSSGGGALPAVIRATEKPPCTLSWGSWRQLPVIDSAKYETTCTSSGKHGIRGTLLVGERNGTQDNLGKLDTR